jgi:methyl-accepting chemotaxis protein
MNQEEVEIVQATWATITPHGEAFVQLFYQHLFEHNPKLQTLFKRNMGEQGEKLMNMFSLAVEHMDHPEKIVPTLTTAGKRHIQYGVQPRDYETVRQAFIQTLAETLGDKFDDQTRLAWELAYNGIQNIMKSAGYQRD